MGHIISIIALPPYLDVDRCIVGMNKMVINHLEKLFVTNDAATILRELEVGHCHLFPKDNVCWNAKGPVQSWIIHTIVGFFFLIICRSSTQQQR